MIAGAKELIAYSVWRATLRLHVNISLSLLVGVAGVKFYVSSFNCLLVSP